MGVEGIGARVARKEDKRFLMGQGRYTDDMSVPGMRYAVYEKSPVYNGKFVSANLDEVKALPGVRGVYVIKGNVTEIGGGLYNGLTDGVAIVADKWHQANRALEKLKVKWDNGETGKRSTAGFVAKAAEIAVGFAVDGLVGIQEPLRGGPVGTDAVHRLEQIGRCIGYLRDAVRGLQPVPGIPGVD